MSVIEIVGGAILLVVSAVIILLTPDAAHPRSGSGRCHQRWCGRCQQCTPDPCGSMLAKVTRIAGIVFFVVAILACVFASRLA